MNKSSVVFNGGNRMPVVVRSAAIQTHSQTLRERAIEFLTIQGQEIVCFMPCQSNWRLSKE